MPVRLALVDGERLVPWEADETLPAWKRWSLSEVKLSAKRVSWEAEGATEWKAQIDSVRSAWARFEQRIPMLVLERSDDGWSGLLTSPSNDGRATRISYTPVTGVSYVS